MPQTVTRDKARAAKQREERGYSFPLPYTGGLWREDDPELPDPKLVGTPKGHARVRRIPMARLASITGLSGEMQTRILDVFRDIQDGKSFVVNTWGDMARNQNRQEEVADALCIAGFMDPRLVEAEAEADAANDPNVVWVKEIHVTDRVAYMLSVMQPESEAAKAIAPFPADGLEGAGLDEGLPPATPPVGALASTPGDGLQPVGLPVF